MIPFLVAVDPGASGGVAWRTVAGAIESVAMPDDAAGVVTLFRRLDALARLGGAPVRCYVERVTGFIRGADAEPEPGVKPVFRLEQQASAMFSFGEGFGVIQGAALALGWRVSLENPRTWQTPLFLKKAKGTGREAWKRQLKAEAVRHFPGLKVTLKNCDALLILRFASQVERVAL